MPPSLEYAHAVPGREAFIGQRSSPRATCIVFAFPTLIRPHLEKPHCECFWQSERLMLTAKPSSADQPQIRLRRS